MHEYNLREQEEIISKGIELLKKITNTQPIAHRAGSFAADNNTLKALIKNGIFIDSSYVKEYKNCKIDLNNKLLTEGKIKEVPISTKKCLLRLKE